MKAAQYARRGHPPDVVEIVELETGAPAPGEVVIAVEASPINPSDLLVLSGQYGVLPPLPAIPGNEGVGRVIAVGATGAEVAAVAKLKLGDRVEVSVGPAALAFTLCVTLSLVAAALFDPHTLWEGQA